MKCLSVRQPWAWLIVNGHKDIENRTWKTGHRGAILIHAGKTFNLEGWRSVRLNFPGIPLPCRESLAMGAVIGGVSVTEMVREHQSPWFSGPWGWVLEDAWAATDALPVKGRLGLFNIDDGSLA